MPLHLLAESVEAVPYGLFLMIATAEAVAIVALAGVVYRLALRGVDREIAAAVAEEKIAKALEENTEVLRDVQAFLKS